VKAVALLVVYMGYVLVAYGVNHVTGGCVSFKDTILPVGGSISDPCSSSSSTSSSGAPVSSVPSQAINNGGNATNLPGAGTNGGSGHPTTIRPSGPNYSIKGQPSTSGNPHGLTYT
jgi:hypothetical protein